ncbi:hypothetical protein CYR55_12330 [Chimaeribacter californicus]|uniref:YdgH/BhsA/McbA-like domain-containing protein n=2 Tax=Chimaeribacter californicus TaxID=2060067 RepID=A0A2N5E5C3_9GAMM|nr:hypothetical protein CYR55_12330 [Chimaeribacter californicus]
MKALPMLTSCCLALGLLASAAQAADAVSAAKAAQLTPIGSVYLQGVPGGPQQVDALIARQAAAKGAGYYRINSVQESQSKSSWHATATLYR